jgi:hypothetical protein
MENCTASIKKLLEKVEVYSNTSVELCKYNMIYKSSAIISTILAKLVLGIIFIILFLFLNIGLALLVGDFFGKSYYGFFIIAGFYMVLVFLFKLFQNQLIKKPVCNYIIRKTLKDNEDES